MSQVKDIQRKMSNYADFRSAVMASGFSVNNFYDVVFNISPKEIDKGHSLYDELQKNPATLPTIKINAEWGATELMRLYTEEASLPGVQMSTGEYRINNTPQLKYAYGSVFSEINFSFMMDADSIIKSVFDVWTNWIYAYSAGTSSWSSDSRNRFRAHYRDDYCVDIDIIKYEKATSSRNNKKPYNFNQGAFRLYDIVPDFRGRTNYNWELQDFAKPVPTHAVKLFNAFPVNVASVPLAYGDTSINKLSVGFEYEHYTTTSLNNNQFNGAGDNINGGGYSSADLARSQGRLQDFARVIGGII